MLDELYQDLLLDYAKKPRNFRQLPEAGLDIQLLNPLCGDEVHLFLDIEQNKVKDISFLGHGCLISQASASILTDIVKGKSINEAKEMIQIFRRLVLGQASEEEKKCVGDLQALEGIKNYPVRGKCALLACEALETLIKRHETHCNDLCDAQNCPYDCPEK